MKKAITIITMLLVVFAGLGIYTPVQAAAYGTHFTTSITYQNVGNATATVVLNFYPEADGTPISIDLPDLNSFAGSSLFVGSISQVSAGFSGSAVMSSDQPLVATLVQVPPTSSPVKVRPLTNGFDSGASSVLIPTVLKSTFGFTSIFSIQNVDTVGADLSIEFIPVSGTPFTVTVTNLPSGSAKYYDMGTFTNASLGASFNGSVRVTALKTGTSTPGAVIATSLELGLNLNNAYGFEGATVFGTNLYMPSAFCKYTAANYLSVYAVQNVGTSPIDITVTYSNTNTETYAAVAGGAKVSINGCGKTGTLNPSGFIGSAVVTGTGPITGMAKVSTNTGMITAFLGFTEGAEKIALPFVRWTADATYNSGARSRGVIAIQNLGSAIAAGDAVVEYYDKDGALVGTHTLPAIPAGGKVNSRPIDASASLIEFGYYANGTFGGSAVVVGPTGSTLAAIVRISTNGGGVLAAEDYNGIPIQ
jgi:hypothetical protein